MNTLGRILATTVVPLALLSAACGSEEDGSNRGPSKAADPASVSPETPAPSESEAPDEPGGEKSAEIIDTDFRPVKLVVSAGTTVTWEQTGDQPHSVSSNDDVFDSSPKCSPTASDRCLGEGDEFTFTFNQGGTFKYYCRVHGLPDGTGMTGTVVVQ